MVEAYHSEMGSLLTSHTAKSEQSISLWTWRETESFHLYLWYISKLLFIERLFNQLWICPLQVVDFKFHAATSKYWISSNMIWSVEEISCLICWLAFKQLPDKGRQSGLFFFPFVREQQCHGGRDMHLSSEEHRLNTRCLTELQLVVFQCGT